MAKTTNFQDIRRFSQSVVAAGGKLPEPLQNLVKAHAILTAPTPLPGPGTGPETDIVDAAIDGSLTEERLQELLPQAATTAMITAYRKTLSADTERHLLSTWHRLMDKGCADQILNSMRPTFDAHAKKIAEAKSLGINTESDAEHILATAEPGVTEAWRTLGDHINAIGKVVLCARNFGPKPTSMFSQIAEAPDADNFRLADEALMATAGPLEQESAWFLKPDGPHRASALFRVSLKLHSIESARQRYADYAAECWDGLHSGPVGGWLDEHSNYHENERPINPYRAKVKA